MTPASIRHNNPGGMKWAPWQADFGGKPGAKSPDGTRYAYFDTPEDGFAAAANLQQRYEGSGRTSIAQRVARWTNYKGGGKDSASKRQYQNYVTRLSQALGIDPNTPFSINDPVLGPKYLETMASVEAGRPMPFPPESLSAGFARGVNGAPAPPLNVGQTAQGKDMPLGMGRGQIRTGPVVRQLEERLAAEGFNPGQVDEKFDRSTGAAVRAFERANPGMTVDRGIAGPQVLGRLAGNASTRDIMSTRDLAPGGPALPGVAPLDIAFGRASAPLPQGAGRPVKTESIGPPTIPGSPPPMGSGLPASVYEIAGSGGLTSGGPPSQMPGAPFDLSGGSLIAGGGVPGASATMGWNQAPESGVPVAAAHPYHGQRGGPYGETGSRFTPAGRTAAMRNSLAREADAAHFGPSLGDVSRTGRYVPGDTISMMSNLAAGFGRPADFSFRPDLRPEVPRTPDAIDEAAAAPLPADEGVPLFGGKPIGGPLSGVVPLGGPPLQSPSGGDPYAANRAYAAAHPPPTFFAGPGSGALSPPGDVPRFDVSRFASEPNSGGMAPVDRGTSLNDVLTGIGGIPRAIFGPGGPVMSASQWLSGDTPAAATPAAPVGRSIPMSQSPFAMPQPWNGSGEPSTLDQLHSLMPFSGSGGDNYLGGAPKEDRLAGVPLSAPKSDFGPAGGPPAISAAPLTPGGPGYTTIDMGKLGNGVFDMSAAPIYTPPRAVSIAGAPADQAKKALAAAAGQAAARPASASAPWTSPSANPSYSAGASYSPFSSPATISAISNYLGGHGVTPGGYVGYTPPGYTAPSFDPVSGGSIYAYQSNGQGGGTYVDSHGTVHSY